MLRLENIPISGLPNTEVCRYFDLQIAFELNALHLDQMGRCLKNACLQHAWVVLLVSEGRWGLFLLLFMPFLF